PARITRRRSGCAASASPTLNRMSAKSSALSRTGGPGLRPFRNDRRRQASRQPEPRRSGSPASFSDQTRTPPMTVIPTHRHLLDRADGVLRRLDAAERLGDGVKIEEARREAQDIRDELSEHMKIDKALGFLKAAQAAPRSMFESSAGARKAARLY